MEIERVSQLSAAEFKRRYLFAQRPVIVTDVVTNWPAFRRWNADYLRSTFGDVSVRISYRGNSTDKTTTEAQQELHRTKQNLTDYFNLLDSGIGGGKWYVHTSPIRHFRQDFLDDLGPIPYIPSRTHRWTAPSPYFWLGPKNVETALHFDNFHNFIAQVTGRKKWTIFPKDQRALLQLVQKRGEKIKQSPIDIDNPDIERFPEYTQATPCEFVVNPGELLFLPADFPHRVVTLDFSVTLNYFTTWMHWQELQRMAPYFARHYWQRLVAKCRESIKR